MKYKDIFALREALNEVDYIRGKSFAYAVFKNKQILDSEIEIINQIKKEPHPDFINFENERTLLCTQHSDLDENGEVITNLTPDGQKTFKIKDMELFNDEYTVLAEKYKDVLDDMNNSKAEYDEFLEREFETELTKIKMDDLPEDISASFLDKIKFMMD